MKIVRFFVVIFFTLILATTAVAQGGFSTVGSTTPINFQGSSHPLAIVPLPNGNFILLDRRQTVTNLYDPLTRKFVAGPSLLTTSSRGHTSAALLNDWRLLVFRNFASDLTKAAQQLAINASTFTKLSGGSTLAGIPVPGTMQKLLDGRVLIVNGSGCALFAPEDNSFTNCNDRAGGAKWGFSLTRLKSGKVLMAGGTNSPTTSDIFDPATNTWSVGPQLRNGRGYHVAVLLNDGRVLLAGGGPNQTGIAFSSSELYDPQSNAFIDGPNLSHGRSGASGILLPNLKVLISGGDNVTATADTDIFDPVSNLFTPGPSMRFARSGHGSVLLQSGKVLVAGGGMLEAEEYQPDFAPETLDSDGDFIPNNLDCDPFERSAYRFNAFKDANFDGIPDNSTQLTVACYGSQPPRGYAVARSDLTITQVRANSPAQLQGDRYTVGANTSFSISVTVSNQGSVSTLADYSLAIRVVGNGWSSGFRRPNLAAGASSEVTTPLLSLPAGSYTVSVIADSSNRVNELDENNNSASFNLIVTASPPPIPSPTP